MQTRSRLSIVSWMGLALLAAASVACTGDTLYFATYTKVGLSASGTGNQVTEATFGYDRFEGAFVPVRDENDKLIEEAPSLFACLGVHNAWFQGVRIDQTFATGTAATTAAKAATEICQEQIGKAQKAEENAGDER